MNIKKVLKNNKGYMLVEIVLASAIAFAIAAYMIDVTIKLKNKNDDMLAELQAETDKAIIAYKIMGYLRYLFHHLSYKWGEGFGCANNNSSSVNRNGKQIRYKNTVLDTVNTFTNVGAPSCTKSNNRFVIKVPLTVDALPGKRFDVVVVYRY